MPIGSSKLGVLGAGLVPGGTETFNAPGTFSIPPGVKKVSITGIGGTGNPGTSGTAGNAGNPGTGAGGGGGGGRFFAPLPNTTANVVCPANRGEWGAGGGGGGGGAGETNDGTAGGNQTCSPKTSWNATGPNAGRCASPRAAGGNPGGGSGGSLGFRRSSSCVVSPVKRPGDAATAPRAGGGGGAGGSMQRSCVYRWAGGGSGGGGRGNAGNPGGCGGAGGCGVAGTPATFNCVPVTPGCTAPITVGSPGGQVVISWNPQ
jgi:hypothetical protein